MWRLLPQVALSFLVSHCFDFLPEWWCQLPQSVDNSELRLCAHLAKPTSLGCRCLASSRQSPIILLCRKNISSIVGLIFQSTRPPVWSVSFSTRGAQHSRTVSGWTCFKVLPDYCGFNVICIFTVERVLCLFLRWLFGQLLLLFLYSEFAGGCLPPFTDCQQCVTTQIPFQWYQKIVNLIPSVWSLSWGNRDPNARLFFFGQSWQSGSFGHLDLSARWDRVTCFSSSHTKKLWDCVQQLCLCHLRRCSTLLGESCSVSFFVFDVVTPEHNSPWVFFGGFASSAFFKWQRFIRIATWTVFSSFFAFRLWSRLLYVPCSVKILQCFIHDGFGFGNLHSFLSRNWLVYQDTVKAFHTRFRFTFPHAQVFSESDCSLLALEEVANV